MTNELIQFSKDKRLQSTYIFEILSLENWFNMFNDEIIFCSADSIDNYSLNFGLKSSRLTCTQKTF